MISRLSVNLLLKCIIVSLSAVVVAMLAVGAWDSWSRLSTVQRIAIASDTSSHLFTALHNLRTDRIRTSRALGADRQLASLDPELQAIREAETRALQSALLTLEKLDFAERPAMFADLRKKAQNLLLLQKESDAAVAGPKAARRPGIAQDYMKDTGALIDTLDSISRRLTRLVKLEDPLVDQLMQLKQLAWVARNHGGDASIVVTSGLGGQPMPPDASLKYAVLVGKLDAVWASLEEFASDLRLPARFNAAMDKAKSEFFGSEYTGQRARLLQALLTGGAPGMNVDQWTTVTVGKLATLQGVAEAALEVAREHAAEQRSMAWSKLISQLGLLAFAMLLAASMVLLVTRRVTAPLTTLQGAMHKLASGDLTAEVSYADREDEIGALGGAMQVFKTSMMEAERLRARQKESETRMVAQRKQEMQKLADEFQAAVGGIVGAVSTASGELESAAITLTNTAENTQRLSGMVAAASEEASANVEAVSAAAEEMSSSVNEIGRQVQESSRIAGEAVAQAGRTDARITELSNAASRIGDVVKLITAIAEQTNLLALNATIEAARAGDAGRGFAVVAQEVKALAAQTAKATDEIGTQISNMQSATQESVAAIKEISGTIGRIAEIAGVIAAAVEEQGAATQEISRNVAQAAHGTSQVAANITDVNRGANETGSASSQVLGSAQSLARESGQLKREVEKFVSTVRAA